MKHRLVPALLAISLTMAFAGPALAATNPSLKVFKANCAACHTLAAAKAKGKVGPNLDQRKSKYALIVARVTKGKGAMPSFKGKLKPAQIKALATWISKSYKKKK